MANSQTAGPLALARAETRLGDPYVFGGAGPVDFDCSGLDQWSYAAEGIPRLHSTYLTYTQHRVAASWIPGDVGYIMGSDPGPQGQPGHEGLFKGIGIITDYGAKRHSFQAHPSGQLVFINAPFTGDVGGVRYDYFQPSLIVAHTRPELALPNPPPLPSLPPAKGKPTVAELKLTNLVALPNPAAAQLANRNGYTLWYFSITHFCPQVGGRPTGITLYANKNYKTKPAQTTSDLLEWAA